MAAPGLPPILRLTLRQGATYYFAHRELTSGEPHYFITLNADPFAGTILAMVVGTSKVDAAFERREGMPPETVVVVGPEEYADFSKPTALDCNKVFEMPIREFAERFSKGTITCKRDVSKSVMDKIRKGILASPLVEKALKKMVVGA